MSVFLFLCVLVTVCAADVPTTPPVVCGQIPPTMNSCVDYGKIMNVRNKQDINKDCLNSASECETMTCIYRSLGWLDEGKVDKQKVTAHFEQVAKDHSEWAAAVEHVKAACLAADLPAQGVYLNCPAYDVMQCAVTNFVKYAQPSKWSSSAQCQRVKQFAEACPLCPDECFASLVPYGACNACLGLPRSL